MGNPALGEEPGDGGSDSCLRQMIKNRVLTLHAGDPPGPVPYRPPLPSLFCSVSGLLTLPMKRITFSLAGWFQVCSSNASSKRWSLSPVSSVIQAESWRWPSLPRCRSWRADPLPQLLLSLVYDHTIISPSFPSRPRGDNCFAWWGITGSLNIPAEFPVSCLQTCPSPLPDPVLPFF